MEEDCLFCQEINDRAHPNIFQRSEGGLFVARWDNFPVYPGHAQIVPVRHVATSDGLSIAELQMRGVFARQVKSMISRTDLVALYQRLLTLPRSDLSEWYLEEALRLAKEFPPSPGGWNEGVNEGVVAGQSVDHLHDHIVPRWKGDGGRPGGIRNIRDGDPYVDMLMGVMSP